MQLTEATLSGRTDDDAVEARTRALAARLRAARAEAVFASDLDTGATGNRALVDEVIRRAIRANGGIRGCLARLAWEYGDHPDSTVRRMAWACRLVEHAYSNSNPSSAESKAR